MVPTGLNHHDRAQQDSEHESPDPSSSSVGVQHIAPRRTPRDTPCQYCQTVFTARGVKLHEQRCTKRREANEIEQENAVHQLRIHAQANQEMYETIIKKMADELEHTRRTLESTKECLEQSRHDHRISLEYADLTARNLEASRGEVVQLRQCLEHPDPGLANHANLIYDPNRHQRLKRSSDLATESSPVDGSGPMNNHSIERDYRRDSKPRS